MRCCTARGTSPPTPERSATTSPVFSTTTTAQEAANCLGTQLSITGTQGVATGHVIWRVTFRNRSDDACNLSGYPTATAVDSPGKVLAVASPTPQGFAGGIGTSTHPPIVTLTPQAISTAAHPVAQAVVTYVPVLPEMSAPIAAPYVSSSRGL